MKKLTAESILITCIVYNLIDPDQKDFFVGVNGLRINGPTGKEVDLTYHQVEVLENAIIDTMVRDAETNKEVPYRKERFKVMRVSSPFYLKGEEKVPLTSDEVAAFLFPPTEEEQEAPVDLSGGEEGKQ